MLIYLITLAGLAVVFADVLVRPGMLLEPVQRWLRLTHQAKYVAKFNPQNMGDANDACQSYWNGEHDLDHWWLSKLLWFCYKCVAGQWGFWGYLIRYHGHYHLFEHLAFTAFTIIAAILLSKWTQQ